MFYEKSCSQKFCNIYRKVAGLQLYKKRLQYRCFPLNIAKLLRPPILKSSRAISPEENCSPPTPKLTLTQTLTLTMGRFSSEAIVYLPPNPKTNPNLDQNPTINRGQFSSGGNCPDTILKNTCYWLLLTF